MDTSLEAVWARVRAQKTALPELYGEVDFDVTPERFTDDPALSITPRAVFAGPPPTAHDVELVRAYTLMGDAVADAYAALMPKYGFKRLVGMLEDACERGAANVHAAPPELVAFIRDMERTPAWLDMDLVREGARLERNSAANIAPIAIRGTFVATFLNKYAALPMALTGALTEGTAARRVKETASFFTTTVQPGALDRYGPGFKAAAMVRLMHAMVRFNALRRSNRWDTAVYGVPIPQVDQMPAGLIPVVIMASRAIRQGRGFTPEERARVEFSRYRCFLLGLPEDLLADTPERIVQIMAARNTTLRDGFDDETCGELIRGTLAAYLPPDHSLPNRLLDQMEKRFSRVFFLRTFLQGDRRRAAEMGIDVELADYLTYAAVAGLVMTNLTAYRAALRTPVLREIADRLLVLRLEQQLKRYGHAAYTTDASQYRPAGRAA